MKRKNAAIRVGKVHLAKQIWCNFMEKDYFAVGGIVS